MKIQQIVQNSEAWFEFKLGKSSGSKLHDLYPARDITGDTAKKYLDEQGIEFDPKMKVADIIGLLSPSDIGWIKAQGDKKDAFYKLVAERVARPITPNDYEDRLNGQTFSMMARGHILEPEAIAEFEKRNKVKVDSKEVVWIRDDNENSIYSPDAPLKDNTEVVEVKCPDSHRVIRAYHENCYPAEYHQQVVKAFVTNEKLEILHFVIYTDVIPSLPYLQFDVKREDIEKDIEEYKAFEDEILKQVEQLTEELAF